MMVAMASAAIVVRNAGAGHNDHARTSDAAFGLGPLGMDMVDEALVKERESESPDDSWQEAIVESAEDHAKANADTVAHAEAALRMGAAPTGDGDGMWMSGCSI